MPSLSGDEATNRSNPPAQSVVNASATTATVPVTTAARTTALLYACIAVLDGCCFEFESVQLDESLAARSRFDCSSSQTCCTRS